MPKTLTPVAIALDAFQRNVASRMAALGVESDSELWRMVKRKSAASKPGQKTVNNAVKARHDAKISTLDAIAQALDVPLWVLFVPGLKEEDMRSPRKERLVALVEYYLKCDDVGRHHTESMAAGFAAKTAFDGK